MKISYFISSLIQLANRSHSDLQNLGSDDHTQYLNQARFAERILKGLDANKPAVGVEGRLYYATDTGKIYRDNGSGWDYLEDLNKITKPSTPAQGDVLYHDGSNWAKLAAGIAGQALLTQGAGANPSWGKPTAYDFGIINAPTATGSVNYTHGLGSIPSLIVILGLYHGDGNGTGVSIGVGKSPSSRKVIYSILTHHFSSTGYIIYAENTNDDDIYYANLTGLTDSNFTLNWSKVQTDSVRLHAMWIAFK